MEDIKEQVNILNKNIKLLKELKFILLNITEDEHKIKRQIQEKLYSNTKLFIYLIKQIYIISLHDLDIIYNKKDEILSFDLLNDIDENTIIQSVGKTKYKYLLTDETINYGYHRIIYKINMINKLITKINDIKSILYRYII